MKRQSYKSYVSLALLCGSLFLIPNPSVNSFRSTLLGSLSLPFRFVQRSKEKIAAFFEAFSGKYNVPELSQKIKDLQRENNTLRQEVAFLEQHIKTEWKPIQEIPSFSLSKDNFLEKKFQALVDRCHLHVQSIGARVIFREPSCWNSFCWIDVGERENEKVGKRIIAKNSPVVVGDCVVGVVEIVGAYRSQIRLITDSSLTPSVQVVRGKAQNLQVTTLLLELSSLLEKRKDIGSQEEAAKALRTIYSLLPLQDANVHLAKGEIHGTSSSLWRSPRLILKGEGFNYDFADAEGPSRHLHTGMLLEGISSIDATKVLIQEGDLLVTTGMDGVFPPSLQVAYVTKVFPLREGACFYDIEAKSVLPNLLDLSFVTVLPPIE